MSRHLLIDTDPGIDDALAILLALNSPEASVEAITTVAGNVSIAWPPSTPAASSRSPLPIRCPPWPAARTPR